MSNYSEKKLQQQLHQAGYYTQKAPSSGVGILDEETGKHIDQADIVAIRTVTHLAAGEIPRVLIIEEKHYKPGTVPIRDEEKQQLERIREITAGTVLIAVKWKHQPGEHEFFTLDDLVDTGKNWKLTDEISGMVLDDV